MANLPIFKDQNKNLMLMQNAWKAQILPTLNNEINQGLMISATLINGVNTIDHLLSRKQVGWIISDVDAAATIYRSAPLNDKTLVLTSNAACNVELWVF